MKEEKYTYQPHRFVTNQMLGKPECVVCGLLALKNDFSQWAVDKGCDNHLHPSYNKKRRSVKVDI